MLLISEQCFTFYKVVLSHYKAHSHFFLSFRNEFSIPPITVQHTAEFYYANSRNSHIEPTLFLFFYEGKKNLSICRWVFL